MWIIILIYFYSPNVYAVDYTNALNHAKDAALVQSGAQDIVNNVQKYAELKTRYYINKAGLTTPTETLMFLYWTYRNKSVTFPLGKTQHIELKLNRINYSISFP